MRIPVIVVMAVAVLAAGCSSAPDGDGSSKADQALATLDADLQDNVREALAMQEQALESTRELAAAPEGASPETIEQALNTLNLALLRGRQEVVAVRGAQEIEGRRALMKQLREGNARLREVYRVLVAHHPNPTPEMIDLGGDEES